MTESQLAVVVLAAGQGTRMKSAIPKVLHPIGGRPMLRHVLNVADDIGAAKKVVVVAPGASEVEKLAAAHGAATVVQERQLGTGHAVAAAETALKGFDGTLLVLFGDTPLLTAATLNALVSRLGKDAEIAALGFRPDDPTGYGRMVCDGDRLLGIVEHKDATPEERSIDLCFAGILAADARSLFDLLRRVENQNAQGEYYLTDVIALARGIGVSSTPAEGSAEEMMGVNSQSQLAHAEAAFQTRRRSELMEEGVSFAAPETVFLSADTVIEKDVRIGPNVVFAPGVKVHSGAEIKAFSHLEGAEVGGGAIVGPFARLRPGAVLREDVHVGNFVEVKNAILEKGAKANHLTYLGDARIGEGTNIGAGTITCNYDGYGKYHTEIGENVFVGSNTALIAPVTLGNDSIVAAGSVITKDIEADALAIARSEQRVQRGAATQVRANAQARKKQKSTEKQKKPQDKKKGN
jgi:bifunctional UDP-N-acetylglucosamine pyrophosphorylase/glucosamine-1-phosphate N-acetyltransferase